MSPRQSAAGREASPPDGAADGGSAGGELIGDLDGPLAVVGADGTVTRLPPQEFADPRDAASPLDRGWRIEWAVGAEDRWHIASREAAVRSRLVDDMPVTETAMRLAGGDVVQRASAARHGSSRGVLLEFENQSPGPVSLALAVIENDAWRGAPSVRRSRQRHQAALVEVRGSRLMVNGRVALELGRAPGGAVAVADGGVWAAVAAGPDPGNRQSRSRSGRAAAAVVVPLVPGTPVRATVPIGGVLDHGAARRAAASGWQAVVARAATVSLPEETAERAWRRGIAGSILTAGCDGALSRSGWLNPRLRGRASRCANPPHTGEAVARAARERSEQERETPRRYAMGLHLPAHALRRSDSHREIVAPAVRMARTAVVLDRVGLPDEADRARGLLLEAADACRLSDHEADAALLALASRRLRSGRESSLADMAGRLAREAGNSLQRRTLEQVAAALEAEAPAAARDARRMLSDPEPGPPRRSSQRGNLADVLRRSVAFGGDGLEGLEALFDCLVAETDDGLVLAPAMPDEWIGAPVDARGLTTRHGALSFSVRWHGTRPALLWELVPPTPRPSPPTALRCGLDQTWTTSQPSGEALLRPDQGRPCLSDISQE